MDQTKTALDQKLPPIHGIFFTPPIEQHYLPNIMEEIFNQRIYDEYFLGKKDLVVLDLGANIGLFTYYAKDFAKIVYAVEPSKTHFDTLDYMLKFNNITNVTPVQLAIGLKTEVATLHHSSNVTAFSLDSKLQDPSLGSEQVNVVAIDKLFELLHLDHVDFCKLDIEGAEQDVLGSEGFRKVAEKIDYIMGENHAWNERNPQQLITALADRGFEAYYLQGTNAQVFAARRVK